jgi:hypothetical protein
VPEVAAALTAKGRPVPSTPAEWIIDAAEEQIRLLLSARRADRKSTPGNPANIRAAIRRLQLAMKPFRAGWVDAETAIIADFESMDIALAKRDKELAEIKRPKPYRLRELKFNCRIIGYARICGVELSEPVVLRFIHAALDAADIHLPHPDERRDRLRAFVLGKAQ